MPLLLSLANLFDFVNGHVASGHCVKSWIYSYDEYQIPHAPLSCALHVHVRARACVCPRARVCVCICMREGARLCVCVCVCVLYVCV